MITLYSALILMATTYLAPAQEAASSVSEPEVHEDVNAKDARDPILPPPELEKSVSDRAASNGNEVGNGLTDEDAALATAAPFELEAAPAVTPTAVAFADLTDDEVFDLASKTLSEIDTLRARFKQFSPSGTEFDGTVSLNRPGKLRFDYDEPNPQLIVATGGLVYIHDADLETTDSYPVSKTPLRFLLSKKLDREAAVVNDIYRGESGIAIILTSDDEEVQGELALMFSAPEMELTEWAVFEPNGAVTRVELSDVELGVKIPGRLFRAPESGGSFLRDM